MPGRVWRIPANGPMKGRVWVIREDALRELLARVAAGEDPELVLLEEYANASRPRDRVDPDE
jgi:hypothetical protein